MGHHQGTGPEHNFPLPCWIKKQIHSASKKVTPFWRGIAIGHISTSWNPKHFSWIVKACYQIKRGVTMDQRELVTKENQNWWRSNYFFLWNKAVWISRFPQFEMWAWVKLEQHPNQKKNAFFWYKTSNHRAYQMWTCTYSRYYLRFVLSAGYIKYLADGDVHLRLHVGFRFKWKLDTFLEPWHAEGDGWDGSLNRVIYTQHMTIKSWMCGWFNMIKQVTLKLSLLEHTYYWGLGSLNKLAFGWCWKAVQAFPLDFGLFWRWNGQFYSC